MTYKNNWNKFNPVWKTHMSMAQQTRMRKWNLSWSEKSVSQMRMTSGRRNSWDNNRVSQRKVKYCGLMFCSSCGGEDTQEVNATIFKQEFNLHFTLNFYCRENMKLFHKWKKTQQYWFVLILCLFIIMTNYEFMNNQSTGRYLGNSKGCLFFPCTCSWSRKKFNILTVN